MISLDRFQSLCAQSLYEYDPTTGRQTFVKGSCGIPMEVTFGDDGRVHRRCPSCSYMDVMDSDTRLFPIVE